MFVFSELLRAFRGRAGHSQKWLADRIGVSRNTISSWENGDYLPRHIEDVFRIADYLDLFPEERDRLLEAADPFSRQTSTGAPPADQIVITLETGDLTILPEDRVVAIQLLTGITGTTGSADPTKPQINELARLFNLLDRRTKNRHLRYNEGDISFWHEQDLCMVELAYEFAARKIVLDAAERTELLIADQGTLSRLANRLIPWLEQSIGTS